MRLAPEAPSPGSATSRVRQRRLFGAFAAAAITVGAGGTYLLGQGADDSTSRSNATASPPPSATSSPSTTPDPTPVAIEWSAASIDRDWPGPIRTELAGAAGRFEIGEVDDRVGELGPGVPDWIDISCVGFGNDGGFVHIHLAGALNQVPSAESSWIAYGIVLDTDDDFVADLRVGMDNAVSRGRHREWITDLATGDVSVNVGPPYGIFEFGTRVDTYYLGDYFIGGPPNDSVGMFTNRTMRFYAWASLIRDERVVATDFSPDEGWYKRPLPPPTTQAC